ncbi:hypothetical protein AAG906_030908 [Vitis piasezkii]
MRERGTGFLLEKEERPSKSERRGNSLNRKEDEGDEGSILKSIDTFGLGSASWIRVGVRLIRVSDHQTEVPPPPVTVPTPTLEDPHSRMDRLEQRLRQLRTSDGAITWKDFDGAPVANLPTKFRMPEIERYMGIGCPCIHLRLYSTVMRAHGLDEA